MGFVIQSSSVVLLLAVSACDVTTVYFEVARYSTGTAHFRLKHFFSSLVNRTLLKLHQNRAIPLSCRRRTSLTRILTRVSSRKRPFGGLLRFSGKDFSSRWSYAILATCLNQTAVVITTTSFSSFIRALRYEKLCLLFHYLEALVSRQPAKAMEQFLKSSCERRLKL